MKNPLLSGTTTIVGGKGAWQVSDPAVMEKLHIDHIHMGMGEVSMPRACRQILDDEDVPRIIQGEDVPADHPRAGGDIAGVRERLRLLHPGEPEGGA